MNKSYNYFFTLILLICFINDVIGQKTFQPKSTDFDWKGIVYREETAFEGRIHTNGMLIGLNFGDIKTYYKTTYYHISLGYLRDPREKSQNKNISLEFPKRSGDFIFGKQNNVINIRAGIGTKKYLSEKAKRKGIAVGYDYTFGPTIALLKPYYLELIYNIDASQERELRTEKYSEENQDKFTTYSSIFGGTNYFRGFNEISIVPGLHGKAGVLLSLGAYDEYVKAFEMGIMADIFIKKLPIMVETDEVSNKPYFINFYINILLGKRKN